MKNNLQVLVGGIFLIAIGLFVYYANVKAPVVETPPVVITEDPILGCYVAKLAKDVYVLKLDNQMDGRVSGMLAFNNYEKDSSSGTFTGTYKDSILLGDYSFNSEGMDSVMQVIFKKEGNTFVRGYSSTMLEGDKLTFDDLAGITYDPNSTFVKDENCLETFTEVNNKFSFEHDPLYKALKRNQNQNLPDTDWRLNTKQKGYLLASLFVPKAYLPNTNFSYGHMTIGASTDPKEIHSCNLGASGEVKEGTKNISGYPFTKFTSSDAGAGNFADTVSYRGLLDGDCYAIEYTIRYTSIDNYSPDQGITEFNKSKVQNEFENIIQSFKFLVNSV
ncbi:MAG: hypothetical protein M3Q34_02170 [bacterium]|nr:hypothetical protein [bacterium]